MGLLLGTETAGSIPVALDELAEQVEEIWALTHQAAHAEVSVMVTQLVPALEYAVRTVDLEERPRAYGLLARAYQALSSAFSRQNYASASWVSADRAIAAAEQSGDVLLVCASIYRMVHAFVRLGNKAEAEHAVTAAVDSLSQRADLTPEGLSVLGSLHLAKALVHARCGQRPEAREEIARAQRVAEQIGEGRNDYNLEFGPTNVAVNAVATAVDLGDAGEAIDLGRTIEADALSPERRGGC
ncbi:transcriptional regulator [Streptomyces sp. M10(2022)]